MKTTATTYIEVITECPHCGTTQDILGDDRVRESFPCDSLSVQHCDIEVTCIECDKLFIITEIFY